MTAVRRGGAAQRDDLQLQPLGALPALAPRGEDDVHELSGTERKRSHPEADRGQRASGLPEAGAQVRTLGVADHTHRLDVYALREKRRLRIPRTVRLERLRFSGSARVSHWRIDAAHSNSHTVWRALGAPQDPSERDLRTIEERQGLEQLEPDQTMTVRDGTLTLRIGLPLPSVSLLEVRPAAG